VHVSDFWDEDGEDPLLAPGEFCALEAPPVWKAFIVDGCQRAAPCSARRQAADGAHRFVRVNEPHVSMWKVSVLSRRVRDSVSQRNASSIHSSSKPDPGGSLLKKSFDYMITKMFVHKVLKDVCT